jgi:tRNA A37 threonylcarbamoyltransferase TsaD
MAVGLVALLGAAFVAMSTLLAMDMTRTQNAAEEAQLRQMLLSGGVVASDLLRQGATTRPNDTEVTLPAELAQRDAALRLHVLPSRTGAGEERRVQVQAKLGKRQASQTLQFARGTDGRWLVVAAELQ